MAGVSVEQGELLLAMTKDAEGYIYIYQGQQHWLVGQQGSGHPLLYVKKHAFQRHVW